MLVFLSPYFESKPWHGNKLSSIFNCPKDTGEAWIISCLKNKSSIILNGQDKDKTLYDFFLEHKNELNLKNADEFPILMKIIDAEQDLSIQVHPDNEYAYKRHNQSGKFECWYFLDGTTAKEVVTGVNSHNEKDLLDSITKKTLMNDLIKQSIKPGDIMGIEPGTVHALLGGSLVLETQQPCDITYRLYDYDRKPMRELHIQDSLNVIKYGKQPLINPLSLTKKYICDYFSLELIDSNKSLALDSFILGFVLSGDGKINNINVKKYDSFLIYGEKNINIEGNLSLIKVTPIIR